MCTNDDDQPVRPKIYETSAIEGPQPEEEKDEEEEAKEEEAEDEQGGEARPAWGACEPTEPTKEEVEQHRLRNHLPFRNWCPYCLGGKAKERGHTRGGSGRDEASSRFPQFGLDYAFFSEKAEREEGESPECLKIAVMKEKKTGARFAHVARVKGGRMSMW